MHARFYLTPEKKAALFSQHSFTQQSADTGSSESQVALFTTRISHLTDHLKTHKKDHSTRLSLLRLVGKRKRLLTYLQRKDIERYRSLIKRLGLRK